MYLLTNGCEWALQKANGCTMCGHLAKQLRKKANITEDDYLHQFRDAFAKIDFKEYPILNLYNNGSFLNENEVPRKVQRYILEMIGANKDIKMLVLETRPEFVTEDKVREIKSFIPDKHVELAMGLEVKDDFYRAICVNKGFSLKKFDAAARIICKHLALRTYILLKPPFLTEQESIEQAIQATEHAFMVGSSSVSLEACTVQGYTLVEYLYNRQLYNPPWLWSILEVVKNSKKSGKMVIGLFQFYPNPSTVPYNCDKCSHKVLEAFREYNRTLDIRLLENLTCECKTEWEKFLKEKPLPFEVRLESFLKTSKLEGS
jgi:hypothetical protein